MKLLKLNHTYIKQYLQYTLFNLKPLFFERWFKLSFINLIKRIKNKIFPFIGVTDDSLCVGIVMYNVGNTNLHMAVYRGRVASKIVQRFSLRRRARIFPWGGGLAKESIIEGRAINLASLCLGRIFEDLRCNSNTENTFKTYW